MVCFPRRKTSRNHELVLLEDEVSVNSIVLLLPLAEHSKFTYPGVSGNPKNPHDKISGDGNFKVIQNNNNKNFCEVLNINAS